MKRILSGILPFAFLLACAGGDHSTHRVATSSPSPSSAASGPEAAVATRNYAAVGTVKALNPKAPSIEIAHGDVEGLMRSEEHTSELQSRLHLVCRLLLEKKKKI